MASECDSNAIRLLSFFIESASPYRDYFNEFCDDEHGYCGLYDYIADILTEDKKQTPENIANALTGIKTAIDSDEQVKSMFGHSIDLLTGLRYPDLVGMLIERYHEEIRQSRKGDIKTSTTKAKGD